MNIKDFFSSLGKGFANVAKYIVKRIPDVQIDAAIDTVKAAAVKFVDNAQRREWAVQQLIQELKLPESLARWLVETAVLHIKTEADNALEKAADKAKTLND